MSSMVQVRPVLPSILLLCLALVLVFSFGWLVGSEHPRLSVTGEPDLTCDRCDCEVWNAERNAAISFQIDNRRLREAGSRWRLVWAQVED